MPAKKRSASRSTSPTGTTKKALGARSTAAARRVPKRRTPRSLDRVVFRINKVSALVITIALIVASGFAVSRNLVGGGETSPKPTASSSENPVAEAELHKTAVKIVWGVAKSDSISWCSTGSGAQIVRAGLIITNRHVIERPDAEYDCEENSSLWVLYQDDQKTGTYFWFPGKVIAEDSRHDLALVEVNFQGRELSPTWPVLQIAELTNEPALGAPIRIFSYPAIGGNSVTFTSGFIAGWARDQLANEDAAVLKLDATVSGGSSGSAVLSASGEVIGVVMQGGVSTDESIPGIDCREWYDTNGDGSINEADTCQILGGFINGAVALAPLRAFLRAENVLP
jgi:S1-C subfamily serine protease